MRIPRRRSGASLALALFLAMTVGGVSALLVAVGVKAYADGHPAAATAFRALANEVLSP